ncbi:MAG: uracil-DNA glycosylase [Gammaproteobacteria bacterium]|nr:uracil-DNA glycosylase [Gammaproteobacteria bacterium]NKB64974.1 uracil-DNA glycosylase [Gammaproteobacteria bacterium]
MTNGSKGSTPTSSLASSGRVFDGASRPEGLSVSPATRWPTDWYDESCSDCPRLSAFLADVKIERPDYYCRPVAPFGDPNAQLLVVGLAPGKHGANATGRPFTGDYAGVLLYSTLHKFGFASAPESNHVDDGLELPNCRITNAVKCLPPQNKPTGEEEKRCNHFLAREMAQPDLKVILALGSLAHRSILRCLGLRLNRYAFGHNVSHQLDNGITLVNSYHCSRYNTQTRRLTESMFHDVFQRIESALLEKG